MILPILQAHILQLKIFLILAGANNWVFRLKPKENMTLESNNWTWKKKSLSRLFWILNEKQLLNKIFKLEN